LREVVEELALRTGSSRVGTSLLSARAACACHRPRPPEVPTCRFRTARS
jgi:hypothetical protein